MSKPKDPLFSALGRRGGRAKVRKGFAAVSPERQRELMERALAVRKAKAGKPPIKLESVATPGYAAAWKHALSLSTHLTDSVEHVTESDAKGRCMLIRTYRDLRPLPKQTVRELIFRDASTRRPDGTRISPQIHILKSPDGVDYDLNSIVVGDSRETRITFPNGWTAKQAGELSFQSQLVIKDGLATKPKPDPHLGLGEANGARCVRVRDAVRSLMIKMTMPEGAPVTWLEPWAWWGESRAARASESILDRVCKAVGWKAEGRTGTLIISDPLPGHTFAVRWFYGGK